MEKLIHVKPAMYALFYENLKVIAKEYGYNLVLHGSMNRDMDLIAIPWVNEPKPEVEMIQAFDMYLTGRCQTTPDGNISGAYLHTVLPGGRNAYIINLNRGDKKGEWLHCADEQYYLDISVTPKA